MEHPSPALELAAQAARLVVESGLEYGPAKAKAARALGRRGGSRTEMPSHEQVEDAVREYLALYAEDTQPQELAALRAVAVAWMERLSALRPHLAGAVWRGTATRLSSVLVELYCDDPKAAELALMDLGVRYEVDTLDAGGPRARDVLTVSSPCPTLGERVTVHLRVHDYDELRGALKPDAQGRSWRGDLPALRRLLAPVEPPARPEEGRPA
ncbi:MAG: hypothetical protein RI988_3931 [Pseudomonadota bacterium]|jgi:hypothetical protein